MYLVVINLKFDFQLLLLHLHPGAPDFTDIHPSDTGNITEGRPKCNMKYKSI